MSHSYTFCNKCGEPTMSETARYCLNCDPYSPKVAVMGQSFLLAAYESAILASELPRGVIVIDKPSDAERMNITEFNAPYILDEVEYFNEYKPTKSRRGNYTPPKNYKRKKAKNGRNKKRRK